MTPFFKVKITLGPFANGQTRVIEYKTLLPMMTGSNRQRLVEKFAELFEQVETVIDQNLGGGTPSAVATNAPTAAVAPVQPPTTRPRRRPARRRNTRRR